MGNSPAKKPKNLLEPDHNLVLWCFFCDWHMNDGWGARRHFGSHMVNCHRDEIAYPVGEQPDPLR